MATLDDDLAKAVSEGFRLAQSSIINQDLILSGTGDVTVTLADGSKKTGPSWSKLIAQAGAAGASAAAAKTSETNAKTSETNANSSKTAAASSATAAATSEKNAKTSETNAKTSETNAKTSETKAANSASSAAASLAAAQKLTSVPYEESPFPDVWLPLNDDLRLLAGFAPYDRLMISGQVLELPTKSLTFSRATTATYIDKSGVLRTAAINEPRFEKEGLLIEGQSTNLLINSEDPTKWGTFTLIDILTLKDGTTQATTVKGTVNATNDSNNLWLCGSPSLPTVAGDIWTLSARFKASAHRVRLRFTVDGTQLGDVFFDGVTGEQVRGVSGGVTYTTKRGGDGYIYVSATIITPTAGLLVGQFWFNDDAPIPAGSFVCLQTIQLEKNAVATSYIPTGPAAVTRAADDCTLQRLGNDNYFGPVTIAAEVHCNGKTPAVTSSDARRGIFSYYPSTGEYVFAMVGPHLTTPGRVAFCYGGPALGSGNIAVDDDNIHNIALVTDTITTRLSTDGTITNPLAVNRPTPGAVNASNQVIYIGRGAGSSTPGARMLNGHIRNLRIWHRALTLNQINGLR
ncbi:MAG: LamG-like jellyroll fold domain-containing protein [Leclercia adecarboxylata]|uniref:phage head spike fiber domain-containing protein n=1 Tax=Leclercia adecarboxylata TaxID=83655 RepID=UPI0028FE8939|nr:LamG-like jellyroll fold domain-containing protein [Leclercia adecarboxylata]MDU2020090.1 LamG-like jellyroll fold domain-containing protein [Leclercia adecarboxylata]